MRRAPPPTACSWADCSDAAATNLRARCAARGGGGRVAVHPAVFTLPRENRRLIPFRSAGLVRVAQGGRDSLRRVAQATTPELGGRRSARGRSAAGHGAARL